MLPFFRDISDVSRPKHQNPLTVTPVLYVRSYRRHRQTAGMSNERKGSGE